MKRNHAYTRNDVVSKDNQALGLEQMVIQVRTCAHRVWVWVVFDAQIIPMVHIGRRRQDNALVPGSTEFSQRVFA